MFKLNVLLTGAFLFVFSSASALVLPSEKAHSRVMQVDEFMADPLPPAAAPPPPTENQIEMSQGIQVNETAFYQSPLFISLTIFAVLIVCLIAIISFRNRKTSSKEQ